VCLLGLLKNILWLSVYMMTLTAFSFVSFSLSSEESYRFNVFEDNLETIKFLQEHELGTATYGVTQFADLTRKHSIKSYVYL